MEHLAACALSNIPDMEGLGHIGCRLAERMVSKGGQYWRPVTSCCALISEHMLPSSQCVSKISEHPAECATP